ncbi:MAG: LLM class flavin-dependent oxidoreductase [Gaiellaceae bacterium]
MRYGLSVANTPPFDEPRNVVRLAEAAENAGWQALLLWDHLAWAAGTPASDPWVALAASAQATERLLLGTGVTPLPRRRPQIVAHTLATLDRLSGGRVVFAAGLGGDPREFAAFGEDTSPRRRAALLDEALDLLAELLAGRPVDHRGPLYTATAVTLEPPPAHQIPIWIGGSSHGALGRAARWDGWLADAVSGEQISKTPQEIASALQTIRSHRTTPQPFDAAIIGYSDQADPPAYSDAGATWWLEAIYGRRGSLAELLDRVDDGPPPAS